MNKHMVAILGAETNSELSRVGSVQAVDTVGPDDSGLLERIGRPVVKYSNSLVPLI